MGLFVAAVEQVQHLLGEHLESDAEYVMSAERRAEAAIVARCATRFVEGEMDPVSYTHLTLPTTPYV